MTALNPYKLTDQEACRVLYDYIAKTGTIGIEMATTQLRSVLVARGVHDHTQGPYMQAQRALATLECNGKIVSIKSPDGNQRGYKVAPSTMRDALAVLMLDPQLSQFPALP